MRFRCRFLAVNDVELQRLRSKINDPEITINVRAIVVVPKFGEGQSTGDLSPTCNVDHADLCRVIPGSINSQTIRREIGNMVRVIIEVEVPILVDVNRATEIVPFLSEVIANRRFGPLIDLPLSFYIPLCVSYRYSRNVITFTGIEIRPTQGDLIRSWTQLAKSPSGNIARVAKGRRRKVSIPFEQGWVCNSYPNPSAEPPLISIVQDQRGTINPFHGLEFVVVDAP